MRQSHRAEDHALALRGDAFLDLDGGVESRGPAAVLGDAALELVHHFDDAVLHHVVHVTAQKHMGVQRILHRGQQIQMSPVIQIAAAERAFDRARCLRR